MSTQAASTKSSTKAAKLAQTMGVVLCIASVLMFVAIDKVYSFWWTSGFIVGLLVYGAGRFMVWWQRE